MTGGPRHLPAGACSRLACNTYNSALYTGPTQAPLTGGPGTASGSPGDLSIRRVLQTGSPAAKTTQAVLPSETTNAAAAMRDGPPAAPARPTVDSRPRVA